MYTYEASIDGKNWRTFTNVIEVEGDLHRLALGNSDIFLIRSTPQIDGISTVQANGVKLWDGIFKKRNIRIEHTIEILIGDEHETKKIYRHITDEFQEVYAIFKNYIMNQKLPEYEQWVDMTREILGR